MNQPPSDYIEIKPTPVLKDATMVLAFNGWMDGGNVSTGTVERLVNALQAMPVGEIDPESFYIYNFPGDMEVTALFRPHIQIEDGLIKSLDMPANTFFCHEPANLVLFMGREPNLRWRTFGNCIFDVARKMGVKRILFVGSFGGAVPHTREPRLYVTCSEPALLPEMEQYGVKRTGYSGPGSFTSYLMNQAPREGIEMVSLVAEIPGYLQGPNPSSIAAVTRRLAKILKVPLDANALRAVSTEWEIQVSTALDQDEKLAAKIHRLEEAYDNELLEDAATEE